MTRASPTNHLTHLRILIGYLVGFGAFANRTRRSVTTVTSVHVVDF